MTHDVRRIADRAVNSTVLPELDALVDYVFDSVAAADYVGALRVTLKPLVREAINLQRLTVNDAFDTVYGDARGRPDARRGAFHEWTRQRVYFRGDKRWRILASVTATGARELAAQTAGRRGRRFLDLANHMDDNGIFVVGEVDGDVFKPSLADAKTHAVTVPLAVRATPWAVASPDELDTLPVGTVAVLAATGRRPQSYMRNAYGNWTRGAGVAQWDGYRLFELSVNNDAELLIVYVPDETKGN